MQQVTSYILVLQYTECSVSSVNCEMREASHAHSQVGWGLMN